MYCYCADCMSHRFEKRFTFDPDMEFGIGWELLAVDPEFSWVVSESDVEGGEPDEWDPLPRWFSRP